MSKATEQNEKLKRAIIISVVLHILLIALLIWSSFDQNIDASGGGGGSDIDAVMVDSGALVEQYNRQQSQQSSAQQKQEQQRQQAAKQAEQAAKEAAQQAKADAQAKAEAAAQVKAQAKAEADAQAKAQAKAEAEAQAKAEADAQKKAEEKAAAAAKKKVEEQAKQAAAEAAKVKAAAEAKAQAAAEAKAQAAAEAKAQAAKEKAAAEAKAKAEAAAKAKAAKKAAAEAAKQSDDVGDLLGDLSSGKNAPKSGKTSGGGGPAGQGNQKKAGASGAAIDSYLGQVKGAIQSKFYDADTFAGKTCDVHIELGFDGSLLDIRPGSGDPALCQAAINAARMAKIPKPPSQEVWQAVKKATLGFKP